MIPSLLITGATEKKRQATILNLVQKYFPLKKLRPQADLLLLTDTNSVGIGQIRELNHFLNLKPYLKTIKIAVIPQAEKLTLPAQNALLKILEEPPANTRLILACPNQEKLLPTIRSRCQIVRLTQTDCRDLRFKNQFSLASEINQKRIGEKLKTADLYSYQPQRALGYVQEQLIFWQKKMRQTPNKQSRHNLRLCFKAWRQLEANLNPGLVLGNLLLGLK